MFDGHAGRAAADYCGETLHKVCLFCLLSNTEVALFIILIFILDLMLADVPQVACGKIHGKPRISFA